jgi:type IV secretion system protein VirD4
MMLGLKGENLTDVERFLTATISDPTANIAIEAGWFFNHVPRKVMLRESMKAAGTKGPIFTLGRFGLAPKMPTTSWGDAALSIGQAAKESFDHRQLNKLLQNALVVRPCATIPDKDKTVFLAQFAKYRDDTDQKGSIERWSRFLLLFCFHDGKGLLVPSSPQADSAWVPAALTMLKSFTGTYLPSYDNFMAQAAQEVMLFQKRHAAPTARAVPQLMNSGARWMTDADLLTSTVFRDQDSPSALLLGKLKGSGRAVFYPHNESLVTIAGSGTGKSQAHVITNLLHYRGSAFVLDVKGEIWEKTAGYREKNFGPCYRFSPTDSQGLSHCYDPFAEIPADPIAAANACAVMAEQLVGEDTSRDKFWSNRARDYIRAFATLIALTHEPSKRNIGYLPHYLSLSTTFDKKTKPYQGSETQRVMTAMRETSARFNIPDLASAANAFENALQDNTRLESIFDTARQFCSVFTSSHLVLSSLVRSSWKPSDLLKRQGTTVYISLRPGELKAFSPIVRLIFQQHANALITARRNPGDLPVTFFLDELPQLGPLSSITDLLDLGRSAGIRLWMFSQYMGQFTKAYGNLTKGLIEGCRTACWMRPDSEAAQFIRPSLGETTEFFSGKSSPLATEAELRGPDFADDIIVMTPGEHPMRLSKVLAFEVIPNRMKIPAPAVPAIKPATVVTP